MKMPVFANSDKKQTKKIKIKADAEMKYFTNNDIFTCGSSLLSGSKTTCVRVSNPNYLLLKLKQSQCKNTFWKTQPAASRTFQVDIFWLILI